MTEKTQIFRITLESMTHPMTQFDERKGSKLIDTEIETPIVERKLRNLKLNKTAGIDGIHTNLYTESIIRRNKFNNNNNNIYLKSNIQCT